MGVHLTCMGAGLGSAGGSSVECRMYNVCIGISPRVDGEKDVSNRACTDFLDRDSVS